MQFKLNQVILIGAAASLAAAKPIPESSGAPLSCESAQHPCHTLTKYEQCSDKWTNEMQKCLASGCIKFFVDPITTCNNLKKPVDSQDKPLSCEAATHPCHTYMKHDKCSSQYIGELQKCVASGCEKFFVDPVASCNLVKPVEIKDEQPTSDLLSCGAASHPCHTYMKYDKCSSQWASDLQKCVASGCEKFFVDPIASCDFKKPVEKKDTIPSFGCQARANSCRRVIQASRCTAEWRSQVVDCMTEACAKDTLDLCATENQSALVKKDDINQTQPSDLVCQVRANACRYQIKADRCTSEWKEQVLRCMPEACVKDSFDECASQVQPAEPVKQMTAAACKIHSGACRFQVTAPRCSAEWKKQVTGCMPLACIADDVAACDNENANKTQ